jgi:3-hydroxyisobutyrate dehydrogenase
MARIAFLGAGNMGRGMIGRLLGAGHAVRVYNRTPAKAHALATAGAVVAATPREAAEGAAAIFSMVGDDGASRAVWLGPDGALAGRPAPGAFVVECSTLSYDWVPELARAAQAKGLRYIDCPVTGLPDAAAAGKLTLFVGADRIDLGAARPLLAPLCAEIIHFGPVGAGTAYKLIVNLMGAVQIAGVAEALLMAEAAGLDLKQVDYAISKGQAASPQVVRHSARMSRGEHEPVVFSGALRLKDALYGVAMARKLGVPPALGQTAAAAFQRLVDLGQGERNESRVIDAMRKGNHQATKTPR